MCVRVQKLWPILKLTYFIVSVQILLGDIFLFRVGSECSLEDLSLLLVCEFQFPMKFSFISFILVGPHLNSSFFTFQKEIFPLVAQFSLPSDVSQDLAWCL